MDARRHMLTSYHAVDECGTLWRPDGATRVELTLVAADAIRDLALLRASAGDREPILLSSRGQVDLGDGVVIVGYPLAGGAALVTNGIVNAQVGRSGEPGLFQTSAAVVPGSSGGPVLDTSGHLVGVVRLSAAGTSTGAGSVAVTLPLVTAFLTEHGVYATLASDAPTLPTREIVTQALRAAIPIECWR